MDFQIRLAAPADAAAIASCLDAAFACYRGAYTPAAFADTVPSQEGVALRIRQTHVLVATAAGTIVGTLSAAISADRGHLRGMAVMPEFQNKALAAELLAETESWLRSEGCREVSLDTTEPLAVAIRFYERHGYRRSGKIADFFGMPLIEYVKAL